jgi:predicted Zn-dependent protease
MQYAMLPIVFIPPSAPSASPSITVACLGFLSFHPSSVPLAFLKFRRQEELEADYLGLQYMYKAGYAPSVYVALLRKLASVPAAAPNVPDTFQDMPPVSVRIAQAEKEIRKILPNAPQPAKPSPEFTMMKSRL